MKNNYSHGYGDDEFDTQNEDNISVCDISSQISDEGQYSIIRNEVRSTWPKRKPKYQKLRDNLLHDSYLTIVDSVDSRPHSPLNGSISDIICRDVDENINDIQDNLANITKLFENVNCDRVEKSSQSQRLLEENQNLHQKIKCLENQYTKIDLDAREDLEKLRLAQTYEYKKLLMSKNEEIEEFRIKIGDYEKSLTSQRITRVARKNEVDNLGYEIDRLNDRIRSNNQQFSMLEEEYQRFKEITDRELQLERKERDQIISEYDEKEQKRLASTSNLSKFPLTNKKGEISTANEQLDQLMQLVKKRTHDNRLLHEELEETQAEILAQSVVEGRHLLQNNPLYNHDNGFDDNIGVSWAKETDIHSKSELIDLIVNETEVNEKLRQYSDKLISRIIEVDPSILEI